MKSNGETFRIRVISSLADISANQWDAVTNPKLTDSSIEDLSTNNNEGHYQNPFLSYCFLNILEESQCATIETGWYAQHLILEDDNENVLGVAPCYLKNHSQGEYVFDYDWADAFMRAGGQYYPKLQLSVPFTPVTGKRLLISPSLDEYKGTLALANGIIQLSQKLEVSSAHLTFLTPKEWKILNEYGFLQRQDQQFHWKNNKYSSFDDFLDELSSRKRKNLRKERNQALENEIKVKHLTGNEIEEKHWDAFYSFYLDTGSRKWGSPYLNRTFFSMLGDRMSDHVLLILAERQNQYIAGALNIIGSDTLYGRYWGCIESHPFLHFEICYYQAIDFAIKNQLKFVEAGAQGQHKLARGYIPIPTYSSHWINHPGLRDALKSYLDEERAYVSKTRDVLSYHTPFKKENLNSNP